MTCPWCGGTFSMLAHYMYMLKYPLTFAPTWMAGNLNNHWWYTHNSKICQRWIQVQKSTPSLLQAEKFFFLRFCIKSHPLVGQTIMYLVSLVSSLKMQESGVCFMLAYTVQTCSKLHKAQTAPLPLEKLWIRHCMNDMSESEICLIIIYYAIVIV